MKYTILILVIVICVALPLIKINKNQIGGADPIQPPQTIAPAAVSAATIAALPPAVVTSAPAPPAPTQTNFNFAFNGKFYDVAVPLDPFGTIIIVQREQQGTKPKTTTRSIFPHSYMYNDGAAMSYSVASLRGKPLNVNRLLDSLTYLVMFPTNFSLINNLKNAKVPQLDNLVEHLVSLARYRRNAKILTPTPNDTVILMTNGAPAARKSLYTIKKGAPFQSSDVQIIDTEIDLEGTALDVQRAADFRRNTAVMKERNQKYTCTTVEGAKEFLTDMAYVPSLTGCHYESYGSSWI
jgi:hypothetical protein